MNDFPQYIQLYPSEFNFAPQIVGGIVYFGWKQITIITQTESLFLTVTHNYNRTYRQKETLHGACHCREVVNCSSEVQNV